MNILYLCFVRPIELLLGFLFGRYFALSGHYGISLVLLSLSVTLLTAPLYYLAERWKRAEEEIKFRMRRELSGVKRYYSGQKRFYLTQNVHRLYGYNPLLALRASFGLFVQIPFFFAAYQLLSHHAGLHGQTFLFIGDLGKPDGLLGGIHILPFVMTFINLASALAYTRSVSLRENGSLFALSAAFLVLLYDRPSALLVYWTMNNVFSLAKNLFFPARRAVQPAGGEAEPGAIAAGIAWLRELYGGSLYRPAIGIAAFALLAAQSWWLIYFAASFEYCVIATGILAVCLSMLVCVKAIKALGIRRAAADLAPLVLTWILFVVSAYFLLFDRRQNALISNRNIKMLASAILDLAAWTAATKLRPSVTRPVPFGPGIYAAGLAYLALDLFIISPLKVYFSSPTDIGMSPYTLVAGNLPALAAFLMAGCFPLLVSIPTKRRPDRRPPESLPLGLVIAAIAFTALTGAGYGMLDEFALERAFLLDHPSAWLFIIDIAVLGASFAAARWSCHKKHGAVIPALAILLLAGAVQVSVAASKSEPGSLAEASANAVHDGNLPPESAEIHRFSRRGPNVVFVIADMFNGNYLGDALEASPKRKELLDGFTWYPNVLAAASHTATSLPSVYGGFDFEPSRLGDMPGTGGEKLGRAAVRFFGGLQDKGFSVGVVDLLYADYPAFALIKGKLTESRSASYVGHWRVVRGSMEAARQNPKNALLSMLTVFDASPFMLKAWIYDQSGWIVFRKNYQFAYIARKTVGNFAYLDLLPELSTSAADGKPRLLFIHTQFTHEPFGVDANGSIISDGYPDSTTKSFIDATSARYTARAFVDALLRWTDWMKREGVYDNTIIVVLSDHGNNASDQGFPVPDILDNPLERHDISRAHALLLCKPLGTRAPFLRDDRFLSTADAPAILYNDLGDATSYGPNPVVGMAPVDRELSFARLRGDWADFLGKTDSGFTFYRVRGDMNDPAAWSKDRP
ncbi:MAG: YidC/Oxa1 family membrane protein insertase [Spirochaetes bacterium]|nr:YidC/Oxa1 family membrane protein insertase [Spirochaetota bacterium]